MPNKRMPSEEELSALPIQLTDKMDYPMAQMLHDTDDVQAVVKQIPYFDLEEWGNVLVDYALWLLSEKRFSDTELILNPLFIRVQTDEKRILLKGRVLLALGMKFLASSQEEEDTEMAKNCFLEAREIFETHDPDDYHLAIVHQKVAEVCIRHERNDLAEELFFLAIELLGQKITAPYYIRTEAVLNLARFYLTTGFPDKAKKVCEQLLGEGYEAFHETQPEEYWALLSRVSDIFNKKRFHEYKEHFLLMALEWSRTTWGAKDMRYIRLLLYLSSFYLDAKMLEMSQAALLEVEGLQTEPSVLRGMVLYNLGMIYGMQGEYEKAIEYYEEAVRLWESLGPEHQYHLKRATESLVELYREPGYERSPEIRARLKRRCNIPLAADETPLMNEVVRYFMIALGVPAFYIAGAFCVVFLPFEGIWMGLSMLVTTLFVWVMFARQVKKRVTKLRNNGVQDGPFRFFQFWKDN